MARMKFLCDAERCIECNGCVTACKQEERGALGREPAPRGHDQRRRAGREVDLGRVHALLGRAVHGGVPGGLLLPHRRGRGAARQGPVHRLRLLLLRLSVRRAAVPAGGRVRPARQDGQVHVLRRRSGEGQFEGGVPRSTAANRLAQGKLPACAEMCSTKALLGGDGDVVADIYRQRVLKRGKGSEVWGWGTAYGAPDSRSRRRAAAAEELTMRASLVALVAIAALGARRVRRTAAGDRAQDREVPGQAGHGAVGQPRLRRQAGRMGARHPGAHAESERVHAYCNRG